MQEGWHYELEDENAPLSINGVVYNEMKGAYSSPDEILETAIMQALFPIFLLLYLICQGLLVFCIAAAKFLHVYENFNWIVFPFKVVKITHV